MMMLMPRPRPGFQMRPVRTLVITAAVVVTLTGCQCPYAFRALIPPLWHPSGTFLPYYFWDEVGVFEKFTECEEARQKAAPWESGESSLPPDQRERLHRMRAAKCVPLT